MVEMTTRKSQIRWSSTMMKMMRRRIRQMKRRNHTASWSPCVTGKAQRMALLLPIKTHPWQMASTTMLLLRH